MDAYIRVSRVGGREGPEYRTPHIQREEIRRWCDREGVTYGREIVEEDVSGGKAVADRRLDELIVRAEQGASGGIVAYRLDRFGRDNLETLKAVKRLRDAGARLVCVADGVDSDQPQSKWMLGIMALQAEDYLDRIRENWVSVNRRAVAEGKHIAGNAPLGYLRADQAAPTLKPNGDLLRDARLVPDPSVAAAVAHAFERRARGDSYESILRDFPRKIAKSTLAGMFKNRAYLGEARGPGGIVNKEAHEPLTNRDVFTRIQPGKAPVPTGLAQGALLGGLITCASCGHKLRIVTGTHGRGKPKIPSYRCAMHFAGGECEAPSAAQVKAVDDYVVGLLEDSWGEREASSADHATAYLLARDAVRDAEEELQAFAADQTMRRALGAGYSAQLQARVETLEAAQRTLWDLDEPDIDLDKPVIYITGKPMVYEAWGDDIAADRRTLRRAITNVTLASSGRSKYTPMSERVKVDWR